MLKDTLNKAGRTVRKEASLAVPAAGRAAVLGAKEFLRRLPQEYAKERKRHKKR